MAAGLVIDMVPDRKPLAPVQREVLRYLKDFYKVHGVPPTIREVAGAFGVNVSASAQHLKVLVAKGWLERTRGKGWRGYRVIEGTAYRPAPKDLPKRPMYDSKIVSELVQMGEERYASIVARVCEGRAARKEKDK